MRNTKKLKITSLVYDYVQKNFTRQHYSLESSIVHL